MNESLSLVSFNLSASFLFGFVHNFPLGPRPKPRMFIFAILAPNPLEYPSICSRSFLNSGLWGSARAWLSNFEKSIGNRV